MIPLLLSLLPLTPATDYDRADEVEIAHFYCDQRGTLTFTQLIFWEYRGPDRVIKDWRMARSGGDDEWRIRRDGNTFLWNEGDRLYVVRAGRVWESHDVVDREVAARQDFPKEWRTGLFSRGAR